MPLMIALEMPKQNSWVPDSVRIAYKEMVAATKAFIELRYYKKLEGLCGERIHYKDVIIADNEYIIRNLEAKNAQNDTIITALKDKVDNYELLYLDYKQESKRAKREKMGLAITLPLAVIASFMFGYYLHK